MGKIIAFVYVTALALTIAAIGTIPLARSQQVGPALGTMAAQNANAVTITGGTVTATLISPVELTLTGGTGATANDLSKSAVSLGAGYGINYFSNSLGIVAPAGAGICMYVAGSTGASACIDRFGTFQTLGHVKSLTADALTANGTTCGTGTAPPADDVTYTTVALNASITLVNVGAGGSTMVRNRGLNPLTVCPFTGGQIESGVVTTGSVIVDAGIDAQFKQTTATQLRQ